MHCLGIAFGYISSCALPVHHLAVPVVYRWHCLHRPGGPAHGEVDGGTIASNPRSVCGGDRLSGSPVGLLRMQVGARRERIATGGGDELARRALLLLAADPASKRE